MSYNLNMDADYSQDNIDDNSFETESIDMNDIIVFDYDPDYEPSEDEVKYYANKIGFDVDNDPPEFLTIAYQALKSPLPGNLKRGIIKSKNEMVYVDLDKDEVLLYSVIEEMAYEYYTKAKEEWKKSQAEKENKVPKVIPRTKIPPINKTKSPDDKEIKKNKLDRKNSINSLRDSNEDVKSKTKNEKLNEKNSEVSERKKDRKKSILSDEKNLDKISNKKEESNENAQKLQKELIRKEKITLVPTTTSSNFTKKDSAPELIPTKLQNNFSSSAETNFPLNDHNFSVHFNKQDKSEEIFENDPNADSYISGKSFKQNNLNTPIIDLKSLPTDINKGQISNLNKSLGQTNFKKNENSTSSILEEAKRKDYHNKKLQELREFEKKLKEDFKIKKKSYKEEKVSLTTKISEEYDKKIILDKRMLKNVNDKETENELKEFEIELENVFEVECKAIEKRNRLEFDFKKEIDKNSEILNLNENISNFKLEKVTLNEMIQNLQIKNYNQKEQEDKFISEARKVLDEKIISDKKILEKNFSKKKKDIEVQEEQKYNREIEKIKFDLSKHFEEKKKQIYNSKQIENFQSEIDEELRNHMTSIQNEHEDRFLEDLNNLQIISQNEKDEKNIIFEEELLEVENFYFIEIKKLREENKNMKYETDLELKLNFEEILKKFEQIKKNISTKSDLYILEFSKKLKLLKQNENMMIDSDFQMMESMLEEFVIELLNEEIIACHKNKANYELVESEYKQKSLSLEYYLKIGEILIKLVKENLETNSVKNENQNISGNILSQSDLVDKIKIRHKEFKAKYEKLKEKKMYSILDEMQGSSNSLRHSRSEYFSSRSSQFSKERNNFLNNSRNTNGFLPSSSSRRLYNNDANLNSNSLFLRENSPKHESFSFTNKNIMNKDKHSITENSREIISSTPIQAIDGKDKDKDHPVRLDKLIQTKSSYCFNQNMSYMNSNYLLEKDIDIDDDKNRYHPKNLYDNPSDNIINNDNNKSSSQEYNLQFKFHRFKNAENIRMNTSPLINSNRTNEEINSCIIEILRDLESLIEDLDDEDKAIINIMTKFVMHEGNKLEKELSYLNNNKGILKNLENSLEILDDNLHKDYNSIKYNNPMTKYSKLLGYIEEIQYDSVKLKSNEKKIFNRKKIYESIANNIESCLNFIRDGDTYNKILIKEKFVMIKNHINEYYNNFEIGRIKFSNSFAPGDNDNVYGKAKLENSTDFFIAQKMKDVGQDKNNFSSNKFNVSHDNSMSNASAFNRFLTAYDENSLHGNAYVYL